MSGRSAQICVNIGFQLSAHGIWDKFIDKRFAHRLNALPLFPGLSAFPVVSVDGRPTRHMRMLIDEIRDTLEEGQVEAQAPAAFAQSGVLGLPPGLRNDDVVVVFGPAFDVWIDSMDAELQAGLVRAYNRWAQATEAQSGLRLVLASPIALCEVGRGVAEIEYAVTHLGRRCFWARPNPLNGRLLGTRYYDPIYEAISGYDCSLAVREFPGYSGYSAGIDHCQSMAEWTVVSSPQEIDMAILSMIANGVFERFPALRCVYCGAEIGALPGWLHRLDAHFELVGALEKPGLSLTPSAYFRRNCWVSAQRCHLNSLTHAERHIGPQRIILEVTQGAATDRNVIDAWRSAPKGVRWDAAAELYGLDR